MERSFNGMRDQKDSKTGIFKKNNKEIMEERK
jgi:hypothetical protein